MSIRTRLLIILLTIVIIPMLFVGAISYLGGRDALEKATLAGQHVVSEFMEGKLLLYLDKLKTRASELSSDGYITDALAKITVQDSIEKLESLSLYLINNKKPLDENILSIDILNLDGKVIASTDSQKIGTDNHEKRYFKNGKEEIYVTDVHRDKNRNLILEISAPIKARIDPTKTNGVVVNYYSAMPLNDLFTGEAVLKLGARTQAVRIGESGETYLINEERLMVTSSLFIKDAILNQKVDAYPVEKGFRDGEEVKGFWQNYRGIQVVGSSMLIEVGEFTWVLISEQNIA